MISIPSVVAGTVFSVLWCLYCAATDKKDPSRYLLLAIIFILGTILTVLIVG